MAIRIRRREFIVAIGGAAVAWPLAAHTQQPLPVIGFLGSRSAEDSVDLVDAFRAGLNEIGFAEDRNVKIEFRWARAHYDRLPSLSADLAARQVAVICTWGLSGALAAKAATTKIPVIFSTGADPVEFGLVSSLSRPTGNLTGVAILSNTLAPKQLELLREVVPSATLIAFLANPKNPIAALDTRDLQVAASAMGQQILVAHASDESEFDTTFRNLVQQHAQALFVMSDPFLNSQTDKIVGLASRYALPAIYALREFPVAGGLMSYGTVNADSYRQVGIYAGKILKGAKPGDLPVQQAVKVELVINLKTAKALGIAFPITLLGRADEVIE